MDAGVCQVKSAVKSAEKSGLTAWQVSKDKTTHAKTPRRKDSRRRSPCFSLRTLRTLRLCAKSVAPTLRQVSADLKVGATARTRAWRVDFLVSLWYVGSSDVVGVR